MKAKLICGWCGKFLDWIDTSDGQDSHGLCPICYKIEMRKVDDAFRRDEALRQKEECQ